METIVCFSADSRDPKAGQPGKDKTNGVVNVRIESARTTGGTNWTAEFGIRLRQVVPRNGVFATSRLRNFTSALLGSFHLAVTIDEDIADLMPHRHRSEAVATCIRTYETNKDRMRYDLCRKGGQSGRSGVAESTQRQIVGSRFKRAERRWSKPRANTLLAVNCCFKNNRCADFLDRRACSTAAARPKNVKPTQEKPKMIHFPNITIIRSI